MFDKTWFWSNLIKNTKRSWDRNREMVVARDRYICQWCGKFDLSGEIDHILPLARGGSDALFNLVYACSECNKIKGDMLPVEFVNYLIQRDREKTKRIIDDVLKRVHFLMGPSDYCDSHNDDLLSISKQCTIDSRWSDFRDIAYFLVDYMLVLDGIPRELLFAFQCFKTHMERDKEVNTWMQSHISDLMYWHSLNLIMSVEDYSLLTELLQMGDPSLTEICDRVGLVRLNEILEKHCTALERVADELDIDPDLADEIDRIVKRAHRDMSTGQLRLFE